MYWLIDSFQMATNLRQSSCPQALSRQSLWRDSCSRRRRWQEKQGKPLSGGQWRWLCSSGRKVGSALLGDNSDWQVVWNILALVGRKWEGGRKTIHLTLVGSRMCFLKRDWGRSRAERSRWIVQGTQMSSRVAEVGRLSASAKNAFNSFVGFYIMHMLSMDLLNIWKKDEKCIWNIINLLNDTSEIFSNCNAIYMQKHLHDCKRICSIKG